MSRSRCVELFSSPTNALTSQRFQPNVTLINIPAEALLNTGTLRPLYPDSFVQGLTSTQWISLHLALQQDLHKRQGVSSRTPRDKFQPFLASLPHEFGTIPFSWSVAQRTRAEIVKDFDVDESDPSLDEVELGPAGREQARTLVGLRPHRLATLSSDVERRFGLDWKAACLVWVSCN